MRIARAFTFLVTVWVGSCLLVADPGAKEVTICFRTMEADTSFPAFNKNIRSGWGKNSLLQRLKQELPHAKISEDSAARYYCTTKVASLECYRVNFKYPADSEVFLAKVRVLLLLYDTREQRQLLRESFVAHAAVPAAKIETDARGSVQLSQAAMQKCATLMAHKISQKLSLQGTIYKVGTPAVWFDLGSSHGVREGMMLEILDDGGKSVVVAKVVEVRTNEGVAFLPMDSKEVRVGFTVRPLQPARADVLAGEQDALREAVKMRAGEHMMGIAKTQISPNPIREIAISQPQSSDKFYLGVHFGGVDLNAVGIDSWGDQIALDADQMRWRVEYQGREYAVDGTRFIPKYPGKYSIQGQYLAGREPLTSDVVTVEVVQLREIDVAREVVLAPGESHQFDVSGKDNLGNHHSFSDLYRQLRWDVYPSDFAMISDTGKIKVSNSAGIGKVKVSVTNSPQITKEIRVLALPKVYMEILRDDKPVSETINILPGETLRLQCDLLCEDPRIDIHEIPIKWHAEVSGFGKINWEDRNLFFRAGDEPTKVPMSISVSVNYLPEGSKRQDTTAKVWVQIVKAKIDAVEITPLQQGPYLVGEPIPLKVQGLSGGQAVSGLEFQVKTFADEKIESEGIPGLYALTARQAGSVLFVAREMSSGIETTLELEVVSGTKASAYNKEATFRSNSRNNGVFISRGVHKPPVVRWVNRSQGAIFSSPAVANGKVYSGNIDGYFQAVDIETGKVAWKYKAAFGIYSSPTIANGIAYFGSADGHMYALDHHTGQPKWKFKTGGIVWASPTVVDGVVYFGGWDKHFYAVDNFTGKVKWKFATEGMIFASAAVEKNRAVYFASNDGNIYALDCHTGKLLWKLALGGQIISSPAIDESILYIGSRDGYLYAIDCFGGKLLWKYATGDRIDSSPAVARDTIFFTGCDTYLYALDSRKGELRWKLETGVRLLSSPAVADGKVYFGDDNGHLYGVDIHSGKIKWRYTARGEIHCSPVVVDGAVYFCDFSGRTYSLVEGKEDYDFRPDPQTVDTKPPLDDEGYFYKTFLGLRYKRHENWGGVVTGDAQEGKQVVASLGESDSAALFIAVRSIKEYSDPTNFQPWLTLVQQYLFKDESQATWKQQSVEDGRFCQRPAKIAVFEGKRAYGRQRVRIILIRDRDYNTYAIMSTAKVDSWQRYLPQFDTSLASMSLEDAQIHRYLGMIFNHEYNIVCHLDLRLDYREYSDDGFITGNCYIRGDITSTAPIQEGNKYNKGRVEFWSLHEGYKVYWQGQVEDGKIRGSYEVFPLDPSGKHEKGSFSAQRQTDFIPYADLTNTGVYHSKTIRKAPTVEWKFATKMPLMNTPTIVGDTVYLAATDKFLYALDRKTGEQKWKFEADLSFMGTISVVDGVIYAGNADKFFYAIAADTGKLKWKFKTGDWLTRAPAVFEDIVYFGGKDTWFYALDVHSGALRWKLKTGAFIPSTAAIYDGIVYFPSSDTFLYAVNKDNGQILWKYKGDGPMPACPVVFGGHLYCGTAKGSLLSLDPKTGKEQWKIQLPGEVTTLSASQGMLFAGTWGGEVYCLDAYGGQQKWKFQAGDAIGVSMAIADDTLHFGSFDSFVYAVDIQTGKPKWKFKTDGKIYSGPTVNQGTVYCISFDKHLYVLAEDPGQKLEAIEEAPVAQWIAIREPRYRASYEIKPEWKRTKLVDNQTGLAWQYLEGSAYVLFFFFANAGQTLESHIANTEKMLTTNNRSWREVSKKPYAIGGLSGILLAVEMVNKHGSKVYSQIFIGIQGENGYYIENTQFANDKGEYSATLEKAMHSLQVQGAVTWKQVEEPRYHATYKIGESWQATNMRTISDGKATLYRLDKSSYVQFQFVVTNGSLRGTIERMERVLFSWSRSVQRISDKEHTLGSVEGKMIEYEIEGFAGDKLYSKVFYGLVNDTLYLVQYSGESERRSDYQPLLEEAMQSLVVEKTVQSVAQNDEKAVSVQKDTEKRESSPKKYDKPAKHYIRLGAKHFSKRRYKEAEEAFTIALEIDPRSEETYNRRAALYMRQKLYDKALDDLTRALAVNANHPITNYNAACAYSLSKNRKLALEHLQRAVKNGYRQFDRITRDRNLAYLRRSRAFSRWFEELEYNDHDDETEDDYDDREDDEEEGEDFE